MERFRFKMKETSRLIFKTEIAKLQDENAKLKQYNKDLQKRNGMLTRRVAELHGNSALANSEVALLKATLFKLRDRKRERWQI